MKFIELKKIKVSETYFNEIREAVTHNKESSLTVEVWEGIEDEIPSFARTGQKAPEGFIYLRIGWEEAYSAAKILVSEKSIPETYFCNFNRESASSLGGFFIEKGISEKVFSEWLEKMIGNYMEFSSFYGGPVKTIVKIIGKTSVETEDGEEKYMKDGTSSVHPGDKIRKFQWWWIPV